jgi:hypothetical protein
VAVFRSVTQATLDSRLRGNDEVLRADDGNVGRRCGKGIVVAAKAKLSIVVPAQAGT